MSPGAGGTGLTAGVDSGTQSVRVVVADAEGRQVAASAAAHPEGCVQAPAAWWSALVEAFGRVPAEVRNEVAAISVGGQQHGCIPLGPEPGRAVLADASLWCDTSSTEEADRLNAAADFAVEVGSRLVASFTITKLAALPAETAAVCLPHDWLTWRLAGRLVTDRGDASGTGWWSAGGGVRRDLLALAGRPGLEVPQVLEPNQAAGELTAEAAGALGLRPGIVVGPGSGDNMAAALGVGAQEGEVVVSLGTSGTVSVVSPTQAHDPSGLVAGFADATGRFLPLVCTLNCTTPVDMFASWLGLDVATALDLADLPTDLTMLPYLRGERTPDVPGARGVVYGINEDTRPEELLAAAVQGAAAGLAAGVEALVRVGVSPPASVLLVGGGARHSTWRHAVADATGLPVVCPEPGEYAARGMAAQARAVLAGVPVEQVATAWRPTTAEAVAPRSDRVPAVSHADLLRHVRGVWEA